MTWEGVGCQSGLFSLTWVPANVTSHETESHPHPSLTFFCGACQPCEIVTTERRSRSSINHEMLNTRVIRDPTCSNAADVPDSCLSKVERIRCCQLVLVSLNARHCDWLFWRCALGLRKEDRSFCVFRVCAASHFVVVALSFSSPLLLCLPAAVSARDPGRHVEHHAVATVRAN